MAGEAGETQAGESLASVWDDGGELPCEYATARHTTHDVEGVPAPPFDFPIKFR